MFIVLYGINNLGKTTQAKLLVERLKKADQPAEYIKYPIYDLEPSGPLINEYLRQGNPRQLSPREVQIMYALNRTQFEPLLKEKLAAGVHIVAEDYIGTGLAWGIGAGVDSVFLERLNSHLYHEDLAFLFDGKRFAQATEANHTHETNPGLMRRVREAHATLAQKYGWMPIAANQPIQTIALMIWTHVQKQLQ